MPWIEADIGIIRGKLVNKPVIPSPLSGYYDIIVYPGFSDTHAHPQVIDAGLIPGVKWDNSYHWLLLREMVVDEASIRKDIGLAAMLAELTLKRALLEGTTMIALTGNFEANIKAFTRIKSRPRTILLPTIMSRKGWASPEELDRSFKKYKKYMNDDLLRVGVFVHSIAYGGQEMLPRAIKLAKKIRGPLGMHLSEGVSEKQDFLEYACCLENVRMVAVHCLNDDYTDLGLRCSSCPGSNIILYNKFLDKIDRITSFGSDWPHLLGTIGSQIYFILSLYKNKIEEILYKLTVGGYNDYGLSYEGDFIAFDGKLTDLFEKEIKIKTVVVKNKLMVYEEKIVDTEETLDDILRMRDEAINYAIDVYGIGRKPVIPSKQEIESFIKNNIKIINT